MSKMTYTPYRPNAYCHWMNANSHSTSFGSIMKGRYYEADTLGYRFGFNSKEKDDEISGAGNSIDYGDRILDTRLGRWSSVDRAAGLYPGVSPYNLCLNSPILYNDPNGKWVEVTTTKFYRDKSGDLKVKKWHNVFKKTVEIHKDIVVGDVRFIDAAWHHEGVRNDDHRVPSNLTENVKQQIVSNYVSSLVSTYDAELTSANDKVKIKTCLNVEGEAKFISDLSELKGTEELIVIGDFKLSKVEADGRTFNTNRSLMLIEEDDAMNRNSGTFPHEFGHQRSPDFLNVLVSIVTDKGGHIDHLQRGIFSDKPLNFKNAMSTKKDSKGIKTNSLILIDLKYHLNTLKKNKERLNNEQQNDPTDSDK